METSQVLDVISERYIKYWLLIPSVAIILVVSFLERPKGSSCIRRPGIAIPLKFLDGYDNQLGNVLSFAVCFNSLLLLFDEEAKWGFQVPRWARAFFVQFKVIVIAFNCYPYFVCLSTPTRVASLLCIVYTLLSFGFYLAGAVQEIVNYIEGTLPQLLGNTVQKVKNDDEADISYLIFKTVNVAFNISQCLILLLLILYCLHTLIKCRKTGKYTINTIHGTCHSHQIKHVQWVLRKHKDSAYQKKLSKSGKTYSERMSKSICLRMLKNFPFFKYPTRMITIAGFQLITVYGGGLAIGLLGFNIIRFFERVVKHFEQYLQRSLFSVEYLTPLNVLRYSFWIAMTVAVLNNLLNIFLTLRHYRFQMFQIYQGKHYFAEQLKCKSPQKILTSNLRCAGYVVAFTLAGLTVSVSVYWLLVIGPYFLLYFFFLYDIDMLIDYVITTVGVLAIATLISLIQVRISERCLLQKKINPKDKYRPLNVNNRKLYEISSFYFLILNITVGVVHSAKRTFLTCVLGALSQGRLYKSTFSTGNEHLDPGYIAFVSMLIVDNAHNNPIMRVFAHLLWTKVLAKRHQTSDVEGCNDGLWVENINKELGIELRVIKRQNQQTGLKRVKPNRRAVNRWFLAFTLIHNPQLRRRKNIQQ